MYVNERRFYGALVTMEMRYAVVIAAVVGGILTYLMLKKDKKEYVSV